MRPLAFPLATVVIALTSLPLAGFNVAALAEEYDPETGYEIVQAGEWRSAKDGIPWSEPVLLEDDFTGEKILAVYDKNYDRNIWRETERGHFSLWRADGHINVYSYDSVKTCPQIWCGRKETRNGAVSVDIKVGSQVFKAEKVGIDFQLPSDLGPALANAQATKEKVFIRAGFEELAQAVTWEMGPKTVESFSTVFADSIEPQATSAPAEVVPSASRALPLQSGTYRIGSRYIQIATRGDRACFNGFSVNGSSVSSLSLSETLDGFYKVDSFDDVLVHQRAISKLLFGPANNLAEYEADYSSSSVINGDLESCLQAVGKFSSQQSFSR